MYYGLTDAYTALVALRKESVDRNAPDWAEIARREASLSARRAWIEIKNAMEINGSHGSLSARRAWIEIPLRITFTPPHGSLSARRAWIEIVRSSRKPTAIAKSLSARRAWIEISGVPSYRKNLSVALRKESVDRNFVALVLAIASGVALRKESVDRNL